MYSIQEFCVAINSLHSTFTKEEKLENNIIQRFDIELLKVLQILIRK